MKKHSDLNELVDYLDFFMNNMNVENGPTCCQLTALDVITSLIFRRVSYYVENERPIKRGLYEKIITLLNVASGYAWDSAVGEKIDSRLDIIDRWYKLSKSRQF